MSSARREALEGKVYRSQEDLRRDYLGARDEIERGQVVRNAVKSSQGRLWLGQIGEEEA